MSYPRRAVLAAGAAGAAALAGCTSFTGPVNGDESTETVALDGATTATIETPNSDAEVRPDASLTDTVGVVVTKRVRGDAGLFGDIALEVASGGDTLEIEVAYDAPGTRRVTVDLDGRVPADLAVSRVASANGDAKATDVVGDATVETANGDATATGVDGTVRLRSGNGDVDAALSTVAGPLTGSSSNSDVEVGVPADVDATVMLRTANGEVSTGELTFSDSQSSDARFEGTLGDGGPRLELSSGNGDVELYTL
jgi:hypothetical protein